MVLLVFWNRYFGFSSKMIAHVQIIRLDFDIINTLLPDMELLNS